MLVAEATFQSHPGRFRTDVSQCSDPDCPCADLLCELVELTVPKEKPLAISFRVNPETWEVVETTARSPQETALIEEFLRDYPEAERDEARRRFRDKGRIAKAIRDYRLPVRDCQEGLLLPFSQVLAYPKKRSSEVAQWMGRFEHDGSEYLIDDLYCPNPDCPCEEVILLFDRLVPVGDSKETYGVRQHFRATASFRGRVKLAEVLEGPKDSAQRVLSAFWRKHGTTELKRYKRRYDWVKQIGARSLAAFRGVASSVGPPSNEPEESLPTAPRAGRNDPCPCGSGKKFKRCCGPRQRNAGS